MNYDKRQLSNDFTEVIARAVMGNDRDKFQEKYFNEPVFAHQVKSIVAALMFCVQAYENEKPLKEHERDRNYQMLINIEKLKELGLKL